MSKSNIEAMKTKVMMMLVCVFLFRDQSFSQADSVAGDGYRLLLERSIAKSYQLKIKEAQVKKASFDKKKAWNAYLPKVMAEGSYTLINDDVAFPDDMQDMLGKTQQLLVKEQVAMTMQQNKAIPDAYKVNFGTSYAAVADNAKSPSSILATAVADNVKEIPPIQERNIWKASVSAQMMVFSGLKVPYTIKAANHQIKALEMMSESERSSIIKDVTTTYDKLAVISESEKVLATTGRLLDEQERFVTKAVQNGLAIELQKQKIELARQQLLYKTIELENNKRLVAAKLESLSGVSIDTIMVMKPVLEEYPLVGFEGKATDRLDVQAMNEAIMAIKFKQMVDYTEYVPKVVVFGKRELYTKDLSMFDPEWMVGASVRWTLFDGCGGINSSRQAKMDQYVMEQKKSEAVDLLNLNITRLRLDHEKNGQMVQVSLKQIELAQRNHDLSKKQYEAGLITTNEYLVSVNDLEQAKLDNIKSLYQQRVSAVELLDAAGKLDIGEFRN